MTQRSYFLILLMCLTFLSGWLVWHYVVDFSWEAPANPNNPDAFVTKLEVVVMDAAGHPEYQFTSPYLLHYAQNERTTFTFPHALLYENNAPPWTVEARSGEAIEGHKQITLWGKVTMTQPKGIHTPSTRIETEKAVIYPKQHLVTTDGYISAVQTHASAEGVGMRLDLKKQTLDLLSQVRGMYVPAKS